VRAGDSSRRGVRSFARRGLAYAGLLEHFGVRVQILEAKGMVHGFLRMGGLVPEALEIVDTSLSTCIISSIARRRERTFRNP